MKENYYEKMIYWQDLSVGYLEDLVVTEKKLGALEDHLKQVFGARDILYDSDSMFSNYRVTLKFSNTGLPAMFERVNAAKERPAREAVVRDRTAKIIPINSMRPVRKEK